MINRIGKNAGAWCIAKRGGYISDCIIAISSKEKDSIKKWCSEHSNNNNINIPVRGVTVPYLAISDIWAELEKVYDKDGN